jgi:hypothetical protein
MSKFMLSVMLFAATLVPFTVWSAPNKSSGTSKRDSGEDLKYRYEMSFDLSAMYTRDTRPVGGSDTGVKINLGGLFDSWIGLDALAMMEVKSKSYLVGGGLRLVPIDWLFLRVGGGGYADRQTKEIKATPILGTGFIGRFSQYTYMTAEGLYFTGTDGGRNISFGAGLGIIF